MGWWSRDKASDGAPGKAAIAGGVHRSAGLAALVEELADRRVGAILDLGASFNENLELWSTWSDRIDIMDLAAKAGATGSAPRASLLELDVRDLDLEADCYDVLLVWDLLHYVSGEARDAFIDRLAAASRPGALLFAIVSASAPIPPVPLRFRVGDPAHLVYEVDVPSRLPSPRLAPRQVEKLMRGFLPLRSFQLRNGFQEFLFAYRGPGDPPDPKERPTPPEKPPGDWYKR